VQVRGLVRLQRQVRAQAQAQAQARRQARALVRPQVWGKRGRAEQ